MRGPVCLLPFFLPIVFFPPPNDLLEPAALILPTSGLLKIEGLLTVEGLLAAEITGVIIELFEVALLPLTTLLSFGKLLMELILLLGDLRLSFFFLPDFAKLFGG